MNDPDIYGLELALQQLPGIEHAVRIKRLSDSFEHAHPDRPFFSIEKGFVIYTNPVLMTDRTPHVHDALAGSGLRCMPQLNHFAGKIHAWEDVGEIDACPIFINM